MVEVGAFVDLGTVPINPADILGRNLTIVGVAGEDSRVYDATLRMLAEHHDRVPFDRAVTHRFPIEQADEAMQTAPARRRRHEGRHRPGRLTAGQVTRRTRGTATRGRVAP